MKTLFASLAGMVLVVGLSVALVDSEQTRDDAETVCPYSGSMTCPYSGAQSDGEARCPYSGGGESEAGTERRGPARSDMSNSV